jgi:hypothetical protein
MNVFVAQPEFTVEEEDLLVFPSVHDGEARTIEQNQAEFTLAAQDETSEPMIVPGGLVEFAIQELGATLVCVEEYIVEE